MELDQVEKPKIEQSLTSTVKAHTVYPGTLSKIKGAHLVS